MRLRNTITVLILIFSVVFMPLSITRVHATSGCLSGFCDLNTQTNVPSVDGSVWVRQDNNSGLRFALPHLFSFPNGTYHSIEVLNLTFLAPSGARYVWKQWEVYGNQWTPVPQATLMRTPLMINNYTGSGSFTAKFEKQFQYTLTFQDPVGQPLIPVPASVVLSSSAGTTTTSTYSGQWLAAGSWTVTSVTWEGYTNALLTSAPLDLTSSSASAAVIVSAYLASVKVVDKSNNPIPGASVTVTFANTTSRTFTTDGQGIVQLGHIPVGPYSAHVLYQGQDQGTWSEDASVTAVSTVTLNLGGTSSAPVVSAIVLLTIFGVALFLILLAIKVRKTPPPPKI